MRPAESRWTLIPRQSQYKSGEPRAASCAFLRGLRLLRVDVACKDVFLVCAYVNKPGRCENIGYSVKSSRFGENLCLFCADKRGVGVSQLIEKIWRPRRDLNPCYRRESKRNSNKLQERGTHWMAF